MTSEVTNEPFNLSPADEPLCPWTSMLWAPSISPETVKLDKVPTCVIVGCVASIDNVVPDLLRLYSCCYLSLCWEFSNADFCSKIVPDVFAVNPIFSYCVPADTNVNAEDIANHHHNQLLLCTSCWTISYSCQWINTISTICLV